MCSCFCNFIETTMKLLKAAIFVNKMRDNSVCWPIVIIIVSCHVKQNNRPSDYTAHPIFFW